MGLVFCDWGSPQPVRNERKGKKEKENKRGEEKEKKKKKNFFKALVPSVLVAGLMVYGKGQVPGFVLALLGKII